MPTKNIFALVAATTAGICAWRYCQLSLRGKIQPVLAMWLLFCVAVSLSFGTYISSDKHDLISGVGNTVDLAVVWVIFIVLAITKRGRLEFDRFEIACFVGSGLILIFWILTKSHVTANLAIQIIMVIAYFPLFKNLYGAKKNTEPFDVWAGTLLAAMFALCPAVIDRNWLAIIYVLRAIICISLVLGLIARVILRARTIEGVAVEN